MATQEWHEARSKGIGGSDWQHVLGMKPYGCARLLWYQKTGATPDHPRRATGAMERGHKLEALVAEEYENAKNMVTRRKTSFAKRNLPVWWIGNIDRHIVGSKECSEMATRALADPRPGVLECKTVNPWRFRGIKNEGIPEEWVLQVQHYLHLTGWAWGSFAILEPVNWQIYIVDFVRDDDLIEMMVAQGNWFWSGVLGKDSPDKLEAKDFRCQRCEYRDQCQGIELYDAVPDAAPGAIEDREDDHLADLVRQRNAIYEINSEAKDALDGINTKIKDHLGAPCKVRCGGSRVYFIESATTRIDTRSLKAEQPEVAKKYSKTTTSKSLRVYPEE